MPKLAKAYNPNAVEESRYSWWEQKGCFSPKKARGKKSYTIVIPPPNVTGILHMGHALNNTIQDILIRSQRMQGKSTLWIPGTDHAGIATQNVVERALAKEGIRRQDLGREAFVDRVWQWKEQYGNTIIHQLRRLGASCDWSRTRFTMDEGLSHAVRKVFVELYEKNLIYRGKYIINWCPRCQTALANEEAPRKEIAGKLYHIRYPLANNLREFLEVATTRPETLLGDTAVAVHPKDKRYAHLVGQQAILPITKRKIPIIADAMVDREFGTGAVKVTPAHDPNDFQLARRHQLEFVDVMTDDARMTGVPKAYDNLDRFDCRSKLIVDLEKDGVLGSIHEHVHNVGHCYRCNTVIEPRLSPQWFVRMKPLAEPAILAVRTGKTTFSPDRWTKVYLNWMKNIDDWCISRQIWWGHRIPVWYCDVCDPGIIVAMKTPRRCPDCGSKALKQDNDVLDTWFSSWLWPFSTLGWPKKTADLKRFYPTQTLVTAQEIIFFWVARMVMAGFFCMKKTPFSDVYIHGTVRDMTGKKMSKSLGNIIDPLDIISQYGADALRYTLITATAIGQDIFLSEERFEVGRRFANKLWNATRFVLSQPKADKTPATLPPKDRLSIADRWILSALARTTDRVTQALEGFQFNDAANTLYDFIWHDLCDWYLEIAKVQIAQQDAKTTLQVLIRVFDESLRLLHPIMPFVTEELWQYLRRRGRNSIMNAAWPKVSKRHFDLKAEEHIQRLRAVVVAIRTARTELNGPPQSRPPVVLTTKRRTVRHFFESNRSLLKSIAQLGEVNCSARAGRPEQSASLLVDGVEIFVTLAGIIDAQKERTRLREQLQELQAHHHRQEGQLSNKEFTQKAPKKIVEQARDKLVQTQQNIQKVSQQLELLKSF